MGRTDNRESNCQALCPNCHAIKTVEHKAKGNNIFISLFAINL